MIVSPAPLAVIEVAAEPVVIAMPLSTVLPVVTVSAPVSPLAAMSPPARSLLRRRARQRQCRILASAAAATVIVSLAPLAVIEVAAEPVVIADRIVGCVAGGHGQRPGQRAGRDVADQPGHHLGRRARQRQRRIVGQRAGVDRHRVACAARGDRGRRRAGGIAMPLSTVFRRWLPSASRSARWPMSPTRPVTVSAAEPARVSAVLLAAPSRP